MGELRRFDAGVDFHLDDAVARMPSPAIPDRIARNAPTVPVGCGSLA